MDLILLIFSSDQDFSLTKEQNKIVSNNDIDVLLMVEKCITGGICHAIHQYVKAKNKYIKYYDENKESLYLIFWNVNDLY